MGYRTPQVLAYSILRKVKEPNSTAECESCDPNEVMRAVQELEQRSRSDGEQRQLNAAMEKLLQLVVSGKFPSMSPSQLHESIKHSMVDEVRRPAASEEGRKRISERLLSRVHRVRVAALIAQITSTFLEANGFVLLMERVHQNLRAIAKSRQLSYDQARSAIRREINRFRKMEGDFEAHAKEMLEQQMRAGEADEQDFDETLARLFG